MDKIDLSNLGDAWNTPAPTAHPMPPNCGAHPEAVFDADGRCRDCNREADERHAEIERGYWLEDLEKQIKTGFPLRYQKAVADHPEVLAWAEQFAKSPRDSSSLLLLGPTGVGKTHQAYGALRAGLSGCQSVWKATTAADMLAELRPHAGVDAEAVMHRYRTVWLLLIDDLGMAKHSEWVEETLYRVINGRYEQMRPTIFTTNLAARDLKEAVGDRIASRLAETCTRVVLEGPDRRRLR